MRVRKITAGTAAFIALALTGSQLGGAAAAPAEGAATGDLLCERPANVALEGSPRLPEGYLTGEGWIAGDEGQAAIKALNGRLDREGSRVLGAVPDHDQQRVLVVVDSGTTTVDYMVKLEAELGSTAPAVRPQVRSSCHPRGPLDETVKRLLARDLGIEGSYGFTINAATATVEVVTEGSGDSGKIQRAFDDTVTILPGRPSSFQGTRTSDSSPHYGDAAINWSGYGCSSNFSYVSNAYGTQTTATAGHCGGGTWTSGPNTVGAVVNNPLPGLDAELLYTAGQSHTNRIHTTPGGPTTRTVIGKHDLTLNEYACLGGAVTLSDCGAWVNSTTYYQCYLGGCWNFIQLFRASAPGDQICDHGDSGGVVYQRSGNSNAIANGMINAGTVDQNGNPLYGFGGYDCWTTRISSIESTLNVTLRTGP